MKPRIFFHVECFWGIGHAVRGLRIVLELSKFFDCYIASGSEIFDRFRLPENVRLVKIPTLYYDAGNDLVFPKDGSISDTLQMRQVLITEAFLAISPDVVLIEMFPFGRLSISMELYMIAEMAIKSAKRIFVTLRDIQVYPEHGPLRNKYARIANDFISAYTPQILVHSDTKVMSHSHIIPRELFTIDEGLIHQTGYVGKLVDVRLKTPKKKMVVAFGGGRSSQQVIAKFQKSIGRRAKGFDVEFWGMQEGKVLNKAYFNPQRAFDPMDDVGSLIITGGYNSWMDVLSARIPSVVIALDEEQSLRSKILKTYCPWTEVVSLSDTPDKWLTAWQVVRDINYSNHLDIDLNGSIKTCSIITNAFFR